MLLARMSEVRRFINFFISDLLSGPRAQATFATTRDDLALDLIIWIGGLRAMLSSRHWRQLSANEWLFVDLREEYNSTLDLDCKG